MPLGSSSVIAPPLLPSWTPSRRTTSRVEPAASVPPGTMQACLRRSAILQPLRATGRGDAVGTSTAPRSGGGPVGVAIAAPDAPRAGPRPAGGGGGGGAPPAGGG